MRARRDHVLVKSDIEKRAKKPSCLCASLIRSLCTGWYLTLLSDSIDIHSSPDLYEEKGVDFNISKNLKNTSSKIAGLRLIQLFSECN